MKRNTLLTAIFLFAGCPDTSPAIEIVPNKLFEEYVENSVRWDSKYKDKRVNVHGSVMVIANDNGPNILIAHKEGGMVACAQMNSDEVSRLSQSDEVILSGSIHGYESGALILMNCRVRKSQ